MKKITILFALVVAVFTSCKSNDPNTDPNSSNDLTTGQIEFKAYPYGNIVEFYLQTKKVTIDWGDGFVDEFSPNDVKTGFTHEYAIQRSQNIKVNTDGMTYFSDSPDIISHSTYSQELRFGNCSNLLVIRCSGTDFTVLDVSKCTALRELYCTGTQITVLDVSKCTVLEYLDCRSEYWEGKLTSLDVSKCTALTRLNCVGNQLSASALNSLFNGLPTGNGAAIYCGHNPGYDTCDKTIAEKKGWFVGNID